MSKGFWGVIIALIVVFAGIFALNGHKSDSSGGKTSSSTKPTEHIQGKGSTGVTLVEYGDYQCPYCGQYYPIVRQVQAKYNDQIFFQFRNYPLQNLHPNAFSAARAAEAAAKQNKFWEMHDALYENQQQWSELSDASTYFSNLAKRLGLNMDQFKKDYASSAVNDLINADLAAGNKLGVTGTPTFFIDGKKVEVTQDPASFDKAIQAAIDAKKKQD
jgi:protein-disulfide isomerase